MLRLQVLLKKLQYLKIVLIYFWLLLLIMNISYFSDYMTLVSFLALSIVSTTLSHFYTVSFILSLQQIQDDCFEIVIHSFLIPLADVLLLFLCESGER